MAASYRAENLRLRQMIESAREGRGGVVIVRASIDIDRDAFLAHAVESADGFTVIRVGCARTEAGQPYAALERLLRPLLRFSDQLSEEKRSVLTRMPERDDDEDVLPVLYGAMALLFAASSTEPVMILVEDAQWIDDRSAHAFMFIRRRLKEKPILMILGTASTDTRQALASVIPQIDLGGSRSGTEDCGPLSSLTLQELQVAAVVAEGAKNREAADSLHLSEKTIEFHLGNVYRKLEIRSRNDLIRIFMREGTRRR